MGHRRGRRDLVDLMNQPEGFRIAQGFAQRADDSYYDDMTAEEDELSGWGLDLLDLEIDEEDIEDLDENLPPKGKAPISK